MRKITIYQSDSQNIEVLDDNDEPIGQYRDRLSKLMKMGNIAILETSTLSVILRPSKIVGITVKEINKDVSSPAKILPKIKKTNPKESEDIITDV
jgi:hypothetical protein